MYGLEISSCPLAGGSSEEVALPSRSVCEPDHVIAARAVYDSSAATYVERIGTEITAAIEGPLDRGMLEAFAESVTETGGRKVVDVGCGPGRVAGFLAARGLDVIGIDIAPAMLVAARAAHPDVTFQEGALAELPLADRSLDGAVCWYSIIHTPPAALSDGLAELRRILSPAGQVLIAFQSGHGEAVTRNDAFGTGVALTSYRHSVDDIADRLTAVGLTVHARAERRARLAHESTPQAFIFAGKVDF